MGRIDAGPSKNKPLLSTVTKEDMKRIEKEIEAPARRGQAEGETITTERIVKALIGPQETGETGGRSTTKKVIMRRGGMLAMGNENTAQRPLVMGGL